MNIQQLKNFIKTYDCGSISKAAEISYQSQQALSHSIRSLEKCLDCVLFLRNANGSIPTMVAHAIYDDAKRIVVSADHMAFKSKHAAGKHKKTISMCFAGNILGNPDFSLLEEIQSFCENKGINFVWHEDDPDACARGLQNGVLDCVFTWHFPLSSPDIESARVYTFDNFIVVAANSPLAEKERLTVEDLAEQIFFFSRSLGIEQPSIIQRYIQAGYNPRHTTPSNQLNCMWQMVRENKGISTNYRLFSLSADYRGLKMKSSPFENDVVHFELYWRKESPFALLLPELAGHLSAYYARLDKTAFA